MWALAEHQPVGKEQVVRQMKKEQMNRTHWEADVTLGGVGYDKLKGNATANTCLMGPRQEVLLQIWPFNEC